jgi:hypothetical protein
MLALIYAASRHLVCIEQLIAFLSRDDHHKHLAIYHLIDIKRNNLRGS